MPMEDNLAHAQGVFGDVCRFLDKLGWKYNRIEDKLLIHCQAQGEDLPIDVVIDVNTERMLLVMFSAFPFAIQEDKRLEAAMAVCAVNNSLVEGSFDYDINSGKIHFRIANSFFNCEISEETFKYMLGGLCELVDLYNDKFFMLSKGTYSIEQFLTDLANK
ncbi:MAG: YbjN domain-containing protein [Clostridia bacterium]|nr:YbjN domain-containing protein [Clostridia bacterium]